MALWGQHLTTGNPFHMTILCIIPLIKDWEKPGDLNKSSITAAPDTRPQVHRDALTTYQGQAEKEAGPEEYWSGVSFWRNAWDILGNTLERQCGFDMVAKWIRRGKKSVVTWAGATCRSRNSWHVYVRVCMCVFWLWHTGHLTWPQNSWAQKARHVDRQNITS